MAPLARAGYGGDGFSVRARVRLGPHSCARSGWLVSRPARRPPVGYARPRGRVSRAASSHAASGRSLVLHVGGLATGVLHLVRALPADWRRSTAARITLRPAACLHAGAPRSSRAPGTRPCRDKGLCGRPASPHQASWPRLAAPRCHPGHPREADLVSNTGAWLSPALTTSTSWSASLGVAASRAGCWPSGTGAVPQVRVLTLPGPNPPRTLTLNPTLTLTLTLIEP